MFSFKTNWEGKNEQNAGEKLKQISTTSTTVVSEYRKGEKLTSVAHRRG